MQTAVLRKLLFNVGQLLGALAIVSLCLGLMLIGVDAKWVALGFFTVFVFGGVVYINKNFWRKGWFWILFSVLLSVHCVIYIVVLMHRARWPLVNYALLIPLEIFVIAVIIDRVAGIGRK